MGESPGWSEPARVASRKTREFVMDSPTWDRPRAGAGVCRRRSEDMHCTKGLSPEGGQS